LNENALKTMEYNKIKEILKGYTVTEEAKKVIDALQPLIDENMIKARIMETTEAVNVIGKNPSVPIPALIGLKGAVEKIKKGMVLNPCELISIGDMLGYVRRIKKYMESMSSCAPTIAAYSLSMYELDELRNEIERCITGGMVSERASAELGRIRKKIMITDQRIKQKLESIISSSAYSHMIQDAVISSRNGKYTIPIRREYRRNIKGSVIDTSSSGSTLFICPDAIARMQEERSVLEIEEEKEVYKVLSNLTGMAESYLKEISINMELIIQYDFIFAKAKYSRELDCRPVNLNNEGRIIINEGKHPLIGKDAVPLNLQIGDDYRALLITGPNTGGKTVALKTAGLMALMVQSGLHVPAGEGSEFPVFDDILVDIGDGQSIEQSLSTFSAHVRNISAIVKYAGTKSLVIMDELGAGTDPAEGMGFAVAVLEEVYRRGAVIIATTHFSEIKEFASKTPGFKNGCMEFDINTLKPLYRLSIGKPGESSAFIIALKLGMDKRIIERAHAVTYNEQKDYSCYKSFEGSSILKKEIPEEGMEFNDEKRVTRPPAKKADRIGTSPVSFKTGDCVYISSMNRTGIVVEQENDRGEVVVMVMKKKIKVNRKRLSLYVDGKELYPDDYDFDVIFESMEDRKKRKRMNKRHVEGVVIEKE
jgi:DNA mismatch repair protein MutS2